MPPNKSAALLLLALPLWVAFLGLPSRAFDARSAGSQTFTFVDDRPGGAGAIEIFATTGKGCVATACDLVIAMTGMGRDAEAMRDLWTKLADRHGFVVVSPLFDDSRFPARLYQRGGVNGQPDPARWLYGTIERLYDHMLTKGNVRKDGYFLYGHSAGAQFAHRMTLLMPTMRAKAVIAANAGYYTLPVGAAAAGNFPYPHSLGGTPAEADQARRAFARKLHVLLGEEDNDPAHHQLDRGAGSMLQGPHRFARGQFFFETARKEAARMGAPFNWSLGTVPGAAHQNGKMARAAAVWFASRR